MAIGIINMAAATTPESLKARAESSIIPEIKP